MKSGLDCEEDSYRFASSHKRWDFQDVIVVEAFFRIEPFTGPGSVCAEVGVVVALVASPIGTKTRCMRKWELLLAWLKIGPY